MPTENFNLPLIADNMANDVVRDMNALAEATDDALKELGDSKANGTDLSTLNNKVTQHLDEDNYYNFYGTRNIAITGLQKITLPFEPEALNIIAVMDETNIAVDGLWTKNLVGCIGATPTGKKNYFAHFIQFFQTDYSNYVVANVKNVVDNGFDIEWTTIGTVSGTLRFIIQASRHGGA